MNYLAHMYLSGEDDELMIGNFIADGVKGKRMERYPEGIRDGIILHRQIDSFTDNHEISAGLRSDLSFAFGKYAAVVVDMYYDHFLAANWSAYSDEPLRGFTERNYAVLARNFSLLPGKSRRILPFMMKSNWLMAYAGFEGLDRAFRGMARRTPFESGMEQAVEVLKKKYGVYQSAFESFFPDVIAYVNQRLLTQRRKAI